MRMAIRPDSGPRILRPDATSQEIEVFMAESLKAVAHNELVVKTLTLLTLMLVVLAVLISIAAVVVAGNNG